MDKPTRPKDRYARAASEHELREMKQALDEVGSSHPLLAFVSEEAPETNEGDSPLDAAILHGLVHP